MAFLGSLALVAALLVSFYLAFAWGEMAGIPKGGDKTSLGGLFIIPLFMGMRWVALAAALALAILSGGLDGVASGRGMQFTLVLGAHALLGGISLAAFNWIANGLTNDVMGPQRLCWVFGVAWPLPAFLAATWGLHRTWLSSRPVVAGALFLVLLALHLFPFVTRQRDMQRTAERLRQAR